MSRLREAWHLRGPIPIVTADADPIEVRLMLQLLQAIEHLAHVVRRAVAGQHQEFLPKLALIERMLRRALEIGDRTGEHAPILQSDRDAGGKRRKWLLARGDLHALRERSDLRVAQRRLVEGARIVRIAQMSERHAKWN